jgi:hypothetical protein
MGANPIPPAKGEKREAEKTSEALNPYVKRAKPLRDSRVPARRAFFFGLNVRVMVPKKNGSDNLPIPCGSCILVMIEQSLSKPESL